MGSSMQDVLDNPEDFEILRMEQLPVTEIGAEDWEDVDEYMEYGLPAI